MEIAKEKNLFCKIADKFKRLGSSIKSKALAFARGVKHFCSKDGFKEDMVKAKNTTKRYFSQPGNIITVVFAVVLIAMVIYPLILMFLDAFTVHSKSEMKEINELWGANVAKGDLTFLHWPTLLFNKETPAFSIQYFWTPLYRSMLMALVACLLAVVIGGVMAYLITRTNIPFKKFISTVFVFPYIMPSWALAMFWENFFKNSRIVCAPGNGMLAAIGIYAPEWLVYGFWPTAFVLGLHYAPFAYILIGGILRNMDANLEEAATILKASKAKIMGRITLPIVAPAILSTVLLVFSGSVSSYTVPYFLNRNGSFTSISISLRSAIVGGRLGQGYVMATILLVFSIVILLVNNSLTKSKKSYTTVSGKSGQISKVDLKWAKWPILVVAIIYTIFFAIFPIISFALESFEEASGDISTFTLKYWTSTEQFDSYISSKGFSTQGVFHNATIWQSFGRSILTAVFVALIAGTGGMLIGYAVSKNRRGRLTNFVSTTAFLPYLIPALSFSAVFFALIKQDAFKFLDVARTQNEISAMVICIIVGGVKFLPFASRSGTNAMLQLSGEIEEAALINGCPWYKRMTKIIFPIQKSSFISGYLLPFISCMREYTLFALITSDVTLITNVLELYNRYGVNQLANAVNLLIVVSVIGVNLLVNKLTGASIDKGIGG